MRGFFGRYWHYLVVVGVVLLLNVLHVARFTEFSPIDESRHLDYMIQLSHRHVVALGDPLNQETMRLEACRGIDLANYDEPPCGKKEYIPALFRDGGFNNAINHPPLYYAVTAVPAWIADKLGAGSMFDPARLMGGLWLAAGLVLAMRAGELLGLRRLPLMGAALALAAAPGIVAAHATVNPDAAGVFAGGLLFLLAVLWDRGRVSTRWLVVAGAVVAALKLTNFAAIAVVALYFLARAWARRRSIPLESEHGNPTRDARAYLVGTGALLLSAMVVSVAWLGIQGARQTIDPFDLESNRRFQVDEFPGEELVLPDNLFAMVPPVGHNDYVAPPLRNRLTDDVGLIALGLAITAIVAWALRFSLKDELSTIGAITLAVCLFGAPAFITFSFINSGLAYQPSNRYALSVFPFVVVLLAGLVRGRAAARALAGYAGIAVAVTAGVLVFG